MAKRREGKPLGVQLTKLTPEAREKLQAKTAEATNKKKAEVAEGLIDYIDQVGRAGLSELIADVLPRVALSENEFITLLGELCDKGKIMVACVDGGGPRYQLFSFAFTPIQVDHSRYLK